MVHRHVGYTNDGPYIRLRLAVGHRHAGGALRHDAMFSDFKCRGFGLENSQLQRVDRMDRLILIMTLALYGAVSTGMWAAENAALPVEKKRKARLRKRWLAA